MAASHLWLDDMPTYLPIQDGCEFYAYGDERYVLHTPDRRHFLVSRTTKELLEALGASMSLEAICENIADRSQSSMTAKELEGLIQSRYSHLGILAVAPETAVEARTSAPRAGLTFLRCWDMLPAALVELAAARLTWLYRAVPAACIFALVVATHIAIYSMSRGAFHFRLSHGSPLIILLLSIFSILAHEMGHATALLRFRAKPGKIGFGLYLLMPTFFADVSQVWRLPRRGRLAVDLGGVYFQQAIFAVFAVFAARYSSLEFAAPCFAIDAMTIFALNPVFRFDGYWLLADWLELPKLHSDALLLLKNWGIRVLRLGRPQSCLGAETLPRLSRPKAVAFAAYAVFCNFFLTVALFLSFRYLRSGLFTFFERLPVKLSQISFSAAAGDWATMTDQLVTTVVACAFSATAFLGLCLYFVRFLGAVQRWLRDWRSRSTNVHPVRSPL